MMLKHYSRYLVKGLFIAFFLCLCLAVLIFLCLPVYLEKSLLPDLAKASAIDLLTVDVGHIGLFGAHINAVCIGPDTQPSLSIDSIHAYYSLKGLFQKHIEKIIVSGLTLYGVYQNGQLSIRGLDLENIRDRSQKKDSVSDTGNNAPAITFDRVILQNAMLDLVWNQHRMRFPVSMTVSTEPDHRSRYDILIDVSSRDQTIFLKTAVDLTKNNIPLAFSGTTVQLDAFSDLIKTIPELTLSGALTFRGETTIGLNPVRLTHAGLFAEFYDTEVGYKDFQFKIEPDKNKKPYPLQIRYPTIDDQWELSLPPIQSDVPFPVRLSDMKSNLKVTSNRIISAGDISIHLLSTGKKNAPFEMVHPIQLPLHFSGAYVKNQPWAFEITSKNTPGTGPIDLAIGSTTVSSDPLDIFLSGRGDHTMGSVQYRFNMADLQGNGNGKTVTSPQISLVGNVDVSFLDPGRQHISFRALTTGLTAVLDTINLQIPKLTIAGAYESGQSGDPQSVDPHVRGRLTFEKGLIADQTSDMKINNIEGDLPIEWPFSSAGKKGKLIAKEIWWKDRMVGSFDGYMRQQNMGLVLQGSHANRLLPELLVSVEGNGGLKIPDGFWVDVNMGIHEYTPPTALDLKTITPEVTGIKINGMLDAKATLHYDLLSGLASALTTRISNGTVQIEEKGVSIEGIDGSMFLPDLIRLHSAPSQKLSFKTANFGKVNVTEGNIAFQIESPDSLFIEKSSAKWCGGNLYAYATRFSPNIDKYNLIVYCDRLKLTKILEQISTIKAQGNGAVNGRIPILWEKNVLQFENGFLYSTPGDGGNLRLTETDILTAGIPKQTPQFAQLELAREALKDYDYNWVKLNLETQEDILLIGMQLSGKPAHPLPFVYQKEFGGFAKIDAKSKGSVFQGIDLDVNFRVPIDKLLSVGKSFKKVYDRAQ